MTQLEGRTPAVITVEVVRESTPSYAIQHERPIYAPEPLASGSLPDDPPPPAVVLHLDRVLSVTNLGTWIDTLA